MQRTINWNELIYEGYAVTVEAVRGHSKQIAYQATKLGKKMSARWVAMQGQIQEMRRECFYVTFLIWLTSLFFGNFAGFEYLWTHLQVYVSILMKNKPQAQVIPFPALVENETLLTSLVKIRREIEMLCIAAGLEVK